MPIWLLFKCVPLLWRKKRRREFFRWCPARVFPLPGPDCSTCKGMLDMSVRCPSASVLPLCLGTSGLWTMNLGFGQCQLASPMSQALGSASELRPCPGPWCRSMLERALCMARSLHPSCLHRSHAQTGSSGSGNTGPVCSL